MKYLIFAALVLASLYIPATAQTEKERKNEFSFWGGYSPDSTHLIGSMPDTRFGIAAFRYSRRFNNNRAVNLKYTADLIPVAFINTPEFPSFTPTRRSAYAWGIAPLGLQVNFRPRKKYQPFIDASGGFLYFNRQIPNNFGTRFNFTAYLGGGVEVKLDKKRSISLGYKYFHVSNAYRGVVNPGFDNHVISAGYTFFTK